MRSKTLVLLVLMVLGCAKGEEIDLQDVVILPSPASSAADASVDGGSEPPVTGTEESPPDPEGTTPTVVETPEPSPDMAPPDAAAPALSDSGT